MRKDISHKRQSKESQSGYSNMEINKGNLHLKWSREARRGSSHAPTPQSQLWTSTGRETHLASPYCFTPPAGGRFPPLLSNTANEKLPSSQTPAFLQRPFVPNNPSQFLPFSLYSNVPLLCLLDLPIVFVIACLFQIANLCYSRITHFTGKITGCLIFFMTTLLQTT